MQIIPEAEAAPGSHVGAPRPAMSIVSSNPQPADDVPQTSTAEDEPAPPWPRLQPSLITRMLLRWNEIAQQGLDEENPKKKGGWRLFNLRLLPKLKAQIDFIRKNNPSEFSSAHAFIEQAVKEKIARRLKVMGFPPNEDDEGAP
jgi:hypothetical protein